MLSRQPVDVGSDVDPRPRRLPRGLQRGLQRGTGRAVAAVLVALVVLGAVAVARHEPPDSAPIAGSGPAAARPSGPAAAPDVTWTDVAGMQLPVSRAEGPRCIDELAASCFAPTPAGAAFAAVHLLVRTFPFVGPRVFLPTIDDQVTGTHRAALRRLTRESYESVAEAAGVTDGGPIVSSTADAVVGYRLSGRDTEDGGAPGEARVGVLVRQVADGGSPAFTEFTVTLRWADGDWRLVAPAWGDWRSSARAVTVPDPAIYRPFDGTGEPVR